MEVTLLDTGLLQELMCRSLVPKHLGGTCTVSIRDHCRGPHFLIHDLSPRELSCSYISWHWDPDGKGQIPIHHYPPWASPPALVSALRCCHPQLPPPIGIHPQSHMRTGFNWVRGNLFSSAVDLTLQHAGQCTQWSSETFSGSHSTKGLKNGQSYLFTWILCEGGRRPQ